MKLLKNKRYLFIVESPEKAKTISAIFKKAGYNNIVVQATYGHFTRLKDGDGYYNTGIHLDDHYNINKLDFVIDTREKLKSDNIKKLKEQVKMADHVFIASDLDREGEAIAWSCLKFLGISKTSYTRVRYNAINEKAIFDAIENGDVLNQDLVDAAHSRTCLDKGIGYRLSSIAKRNCGAPSVGRVQSAALKIIVEREQEIRKFVPEKYIDLYLKFIKNKVEFKAKYQGTDKKPVKRLTDEKQVAAIFKECKGKPFVVKTVEFKDKKENPKPPFSTATFQQECSSKLGLTVKQSQDCAQKLFDSGKISYHRTDDEEFSEEFCKELKKFVLDTYGKTYASGVVTKGKKDENAQEAHEGLHVLDLTLTPDKYAREAPNELLAKVYRIIYNRTVACALKPAVIAETKYNIYNGEHKFTLTSNELKFDGYRCVYAYKDDDKDDEGLVKETFAEGETLNKCSFESVNKQTQPPARYKEASFVKEMKDRGIGRPSTYASTIETIKDRKYVVVEEKCLVPTKLGEDLISFLNDSFEDLFEINYTKTMEKSLDTIAEGKLKRSEFLSDFFEELDLAVGEVQEERTCPECGSPLVLRRGKYGEFWGCSNYPKCKHLEKC